MLCAYNGALASGVCSASSIYGREDLAPIIFLVGWAIMHERGVPCPPGLTFREGGQLSYMCLVRGPIRTGHMGLCT
jgi:hypothetical protein